LERKLAAILYADVYGYSRLMQEDEEATLRTLSSHRKLIGSLVEQHRGLLVNYAGDSLLAEFASVVNAIQCAVEIQTTLKVENANLPHERWMEFRIGVNLGDVMVDGQQIYGDGVNVAARLESLADPGGICISAIVHDQIKNKLALNYEDLGEQQVKNIAEPVRVLRVVTGGDASTTRKMQRVPRKYVRPGVFSIAGFAIVVAVVVFVQHLSLRPPNTTASIPPPQTPALTLPDQPSIAVLPFINMSGDRDQEYFSDGITEDLTSDLSRLPELFVIARTSAFTYKGKAVKVQDISRELGVKYVLEGSVRKADHEVRVTAQLVDATTGDHLWAEHYDRPLQDIFALQDEIVQQIIVSLKARVYAAELTRVSRIPTNNLTAYDYLLRGEEFFRSANSETNKEANEQARRMFERAIALDQQYALAYAFLGYTSLNDWFHQWSNDPAQSLDLAWELGQRAVALDDSLPTAHSLLVNVYLWRNQHDQAIVEAERTIALDANSAEGYQALAGVLVFAGRPKEAIPLFEKAMRLDPQNRASYFFGIGWAYRVAGRCEEALVPLKEAITLAPGANPPHFALAGCYADLGRLKEAQAEAAEITRLNPHFSLESWRQKVPFKDPALREHYVALQRKAGLK
jgi:adenylate cyclase